MFTVIPFSEHSVVHYTETFYTADTILSPGNLKKKKKITTAEYLQ